MRGWILFKPSVLDGFIWHCGLGGAALLLPCGCKVQAPQLTSIDIQWVYSHSCQVGALSPHVVSTHTATAGWWWKFILFTSLLWHYPSVRESGLSIESPLIPWGAKSFCCQHVGIWKTWLLVSFWLYPGVDAGVPHGNLTGIDIQVPHSAFADMDGGGNSFFCVSVVKCLLCKRKVFYFVNLLLWVQRADFYWGAYFDLLVGSS